jgi:hypothetical protein
LIRHTDGGDIFGIDLSFIQRAINNLLRARPNLKRIVLTQPGLG